VFLGKSGTLQVKGIYVLISIGYNMKEPVESMNGVQGVGSSNLLALTNNINYLAMFRYYARAKFDIF